MSIMAFKKVSRFPKKKRARGSREERKWILVQDLTCRTRSQSVQSVRPRVEENLKKEQFKIVVRGESHRSCNIILLCFFHCSLKSVENSCQTENRVLGETSFSPALGLTEKDRLSSENLRGHTATKCVVMAV